MSEPIEKTEPANVSEQDSREPKNVVMRVVGVYIRGVAVDAPFRIRMTMSQWKKFQVFKSEEPIPVPSVLRLTTTKDSLSSYTPFPGDEFLFDHIVGRAFASSNGRLDHDELADIIQVLLEEETNVRLEIHAGVQARPSVPDPCEVRVGFGSWMIDGVTLTEEPWHLRMTLAEWEQLTNPPVSGEGSILLHAAENRNMLYATGNVEAADSIMRVLTLPSTGLLLDHLPKFMSMASKEGYDVEISYPKPHGA